MYGFLGGRTQWWMFVKHLKGFVQTLHLDIVQLSQAEAVLGSLCIMATKIRSYCAPPPWVFPTTCCGPSYPQTASPIPHAVRLFSPDWSLDMCVVTLSSAHCELRRGAGGRRSIRQMVSCPCQTRCCTQKCCSPKCKAVSVLAFHFLNPYFLAFFF